MKSINDSNADMKMTHANANMNPNSSLPKEAEIETEKPDGGTSTDTDMDRRSPPTLALVMNNDPPDGRPSGTVMNPPLEGRNISADDTSDSGMNRNPNISNADMHESTDAGINPNSSDAVMNDPTEGPNTGIY